MITVAIISKAHLVALGVQQVLASTTDMRLIGHTNNRAQAETMLQREKPRVILIDVDPGLDAAPLIRMARSGSPGSKIVAFLDLAYTGPTGDLVSLSDGIVLGRGHRATDALEARPSAGFAGRRSRVMKLHVPPVDH
jgi:DNA-binding NarL/FixJ family response regulator